MQCHGGKLSAMGDMYALAPRHVSYGSFAADPLHASAEKCPLCPDNDQNIAVQ